MSIAIPEKKVKSRFTKARDGEPSLHSEPSPLKTPERNDFICVRLFPLMCTFPKRFKSISCWSSATQLITVLTKSSRSSLILYGESKTFPNE